jgi:hypothetical protein
MARSVTEAVEQSSAALTAKRVTTMDIPETQPHATLNYICNYVKRKEEVETGKCNAKNIPLRWNLTFFSTLCHKFLSMSTSPKSAIVPKR